MSGASLTDLYGPLISTYTRAEALADGQQFDVSADPGSDVYKTSVYVTAALHAELQRGKGSDPETYSARLWDVCWMAAKFGREVSPNARITTVKVGARRLTVRAECGPVDIDDARPAITLGFRSDF